MSPGRILSEFGPSNQPLDGDEFICTKLQRWLQLKLNPEPVLAEQEAGQVRTYKYDQSLIVIFQIFLDLCN